MKTHRFFSCLFGMLALFGKTACVFSVESQRLSSSAENIQFQIQALKEKAKLTAEMLLLIPSEFQTFENTIEPWMELSNQIFKDLHFLHTIINQENTTHLAASDALLSLQGIYELPELQNHLALCAWNIIEDSESNGFQKLIAHQLLNQKNDLLFHFYENSDTQSSALAMLNFMQINAQGLYQENATELVEKIQCLNQELVCIENIESDFIGSTLSEKLLTIYSNFQYFTDPLNAKNSFLIASKKSLDSYSDYYSINAFRNAKKLFWKQLFRGNTSICNRSSVEISASGDTDGNASLEGRVGTSQETDNGGRFSGDVSVGIERDSKGDVKGTVEATGRWEF